MPTQEEHDKILDRLKAMLQRDEMTAKQIAEKLKTSRPTAYQRVQALKDRGDDVYEVEVESDTTGPRPIAYGVR